MGTITLQDGRSFPAPAGFEKMSLEQRQQAVNRLASTAPEPTDDRSFGERAYGAYKALDEGAILGTAGLVGLPGTLSDVGQWAGRKMGYDIPETPNILPRPADIEKRIRENNYPGEQPYVPKGTFEEYMRTIGEQVPGALLSGGAGSAARKAVQIGAQAVVPGVVTETVGQLTKGSDLEPYARAGANLISSVGAARATRVPPQVGAPLKRELQYVSQQELDAAENLIRNSPVPLTWPEALSHVRGSPTLSDTMRHLEASPESAAAAANYYGARPGQTQQAVREQLDQLSPAPTAPQMTGPTVGETAGQYVRETTQGINRTAEPFYDLAAGQRIMPQDMETLMALPGWRRARDAVRNDEQLNRDVAHLPDNSVGFLDAVKKEMRRSADEASAPMNVQSNRRVSSGRHMDEEVVREVAQQGSPIHYPTALQIEADLRTRHLDPILAGPVGELAKGDLTTQQAVEALFPKQPLPNSQQLVTDTVTALARRNPQAARELVRAHVEMAFDRAQRLANGLPNQRSAARLVDDIAGSPQQRENLRAAITAAYPDGAQRWAGFERLLQAGEAQATRLGVGSKTAYNKATDEITPIGEAMTVGKAAGRPLEALSPITDAIARWQLGKGKTEMFHILTDPGSARMLKELGNVSPRSFRAAQLAVKLATYGSRAAEQYDRPRVIIDTTNFGNQ